MEENCWYRSRYAIFYILIALVWSLSNIIYSIGMYDWPAGDERWHLSYSKRYYDTGETERASVHNYNSTTPAILLNVLSSELYKKFTGATETSKYAVRIPQLMWYCVLIIGMWVVSNYLMGRNGAWWATFLLLLDPNLNAHAALIGTDVPFAAISMWVLFSILLYLNKPNFKRVILLATVYGLAFCTKYSATFYAVPIFLTFLILFSNIILSNGPFRIKVGEVANSKLFNLFRLLSQVIVIIVIVTVVVNCAYSFSGSGEVLSGKIWYSAPFKYLSSKFGSVPSIWPIPFLTGFDQQLAVERAWPWNVIFMGKHYPNGVWKYFIYNWFWKTSIGVIILTCISIFKLPVSLWNWRKLKSSWVIIFLTWLVLLCYFSFIFRTQVGLRYAYPCLPLAYLLVAGVVSSSWRTKTQAKIALGIITMAMFDLLPYFGNGISFTNSFIYKKVDAFKYTTDSNIDWFHNYSHSRGLADNLIGDYHDTPGHILPGNNLISLNKLAGVMHNFDQYQWVRDNLKPLMHFEHTHLLYSVSEKQFSDYMANERTYSQGPYAGDICTQGYDYNNIELYPKPVLEGSWNGPAKLYTGCLEVKEEALIELKVNSGWSSVGTYPNEHNCQGLPVGAGNVLWFRFKPGIHPICANVNDTAEYEWILHEGQANFALRIPK